LNASYPEDTLIDEQQFVYPEETHEEERNEQFCTPPEAERESIHQTEIPKIREKEERKKKSRKKKFPQPQIEVVRRQEPVVDRRTAKPLEIQIQKPKAKEVVVALGDQEMKISSKPVREILVEREKRLIAEKQVFSPVLLAPPRDAPLQPAQPVRIGPSVEKPSVKIVMVKNSEENGPTVSGPTRKRAVVTVSRDGQPF
jgi:hypothetical protein